MAALLGALMVLTADRAATSSPSAEVPLAADPDRAFEPEPAAEGLAGAPGNEGERGPGVLRSGEPRSGERVVRARRADVRTLRPTTPPTRLVIAAADVDMPVEPAGVAEDGSMALPGTPFEASWYRYGAGPLDAAGATVVAAHVDSREYGVGPLARIERLRPGDRVVVVAGRHRASYRIESIQRVPKSALDLPDVFSRKGPPRLHLITCGGRFDPESRSYEDNVVVVARRWGRIG